MLVNTERWDALHIALKQNQDVYLAHFIQHCTIILPEQWHEKKNRSIQNGREETNISTLKNGIITPIKS